MNRKKRILVAPLDWGIGHATRCIPIINALHAHEFEVVIAADGRPLHLLKNEFPNLEFIRFSGYHIKYSSYLPMGLSMLLQTPKILINIRKEHKLLAQIIDDYNIDGVISDNRFGLYNNKVPTVFITHQLQIQTTYFTETIRKLNYKYINRYDRCWIMDDEIENLAGALSKPNILPDNAVFIGTHSRFKKEEKEKKYDFLGIVSGPEPQRSILAKGLIKALKNREEKSLIALGKPEVNKIEKLGNLTIQSHLNSKALNGAILQSDLIICRPGYSTVMDLARLEKNAIFIPTPGQTEQEYLADFYLKNDFFYSQKQSEFNLELALKESKKYIGFKKIKDVKTNWEQLFSIFE